MLGYCMTCQTLRTILPGPQKWGSRERTYYPIQHDAPDGQPCPGTKKEIK